MADDKESPIILKLREMMLGTPAMQDVDTTNLASNVDTSSDTAKNYAEGGVPPETQFNAEDFKKMMIEDGFLPSPTPEAMDPKLATGQVPGVPALPGFAPTEDEKLKATMDDMIANPRPQPTQEEMEMSGDAGPNLAHGGVAAPNDNTPHRAPQGPSEAEKMELVMKELNSGSLKMADGGVVDPNELPMPIDAPHEDKLSAIARLMGSAGNMISSPLGKIGQFAMNPVGTMANAVASRVPATIDTASQLGKAAIPAVNSLAGTSIPEAPPAPAPVASVATAPIAPEASKMPVQAPNMTSPPSTPSHDPRVDFNALFNQDPTQVAPGFNPADRQKAAGDVWNQQHTIGSMVAEALTGLGDAFAAKGGVNQDMLGKLLAMQGDRRKEVMDNFDKARESAVQNFNLKAQMGKNAIDMLAAKDAYGPASPGIIKLLAGMGIAVPPGTTNKDLPMFFQVAKAQADKSVAQGEMLLKATKQAADEVEAANKDSGLMHMKMGPEQQAKAIKRRTAELMAQTSGKTMHILDSDGKQHMIAPADLERVQQEAKKQGGWVKVAQ